MGYEPQNRPNLLGSWVWMLRKELEKRSRLRVGAESLDSSQDAQRNTFSVRKGLEKFPLG